MAENVGNLTSENMRDVWEYMAQDPFLLSSEPHNHVLLRRKRKGAAGR